MVTSCRKYCLNGPNYVKHIYRNVLKTKGIKLKLKKNNCIWLWARIVAGLKLIAVVYWKIKLTALGVIKTVIVKKIRIIGHTDIVILTICNNFETNCSLLSLICDHIFIKVWFF